LKFYNGIGDDVQRVLDMVHAPMYSKIGITAMEMDIFSLLAVPQTAETLAGTQSWHTGNTALFLDAVASLGLLAKESGIYSNTAVADKYLVRGKPDFIGDYVAAFYRAGLNEGLDLANMVRKGPANEAPVTMENVSFEAMAEMMRRMQAGGRATEAIEILRGLPEFEGAKKLLDLGCGAGIIGIAAVQEHPTMQGILFDMPQMENAVRSNIHMQKAEERVRFMGGNYLADDIGTGYDIVLAIGTLNFAKHALVPLMKKVHTALNEGGVLVCVGDGVCNEGTGPRDSLAGWLVSGMQGMDYRMPRGVIADAGLAAGFRHVQTMAGIATYMGHMDIDILRR